MLALLDFASFAFEFSPDAIASFLLGTFAAGLMVGCTGVALAAIRRAT